MMKWFTATLQDVCSLVTDGTHHSPANFSSGDYRYVTAKNIRPWGLDLADMTYVDASTHREIYARCPVEFGDVLYIKDGVTTGIAALNTLSEPFSMLSSVALLKPRREVLDPRYLKHWLNSPGAYASMTAGMTGTAIKRLVLRQIRATELPIAPLMEQQRIADKLDTVLARVDACRNRLARVAPLFKRFRQSVLAAATSGRLTADWRAEHEEGVSSSEPASLGLPRGWRQATFAEVCSEITVGYVGAMASQYVPSGVPFLRSMNVRAFRFDPKGLQYISREFHAQIKKSSLRGGDLAIVRSGAPGVCCVVPDDLGEANCSDLVIARPGPQLVASYGCIFMNSSFGALHVAANQVGVAQAHFNVGAMKTTPLPLPGVLEQHEIVRRVEALFAFADRLEARLAQAQTAVDHLRPSLLAKAFRGELVSQDPADEPAAELLKRLAVQRDAEPARTRRGRATV